ncbi:unnamed protein product [Ambrosiozyma monospora]|uniref:Unnamed protein product n=1 Tax=Ambrosiozyma monospora TaxID=43982 RepID=A0ACB5T9H1_AMBMO|nr:unnamed protein product [Ambrosiozyma monospora]
MKIALGCANSVINYLSLLSDDSNRGNHTVGKYNLEQYMRLDYAAVRALNLFPPPNYSNSMNKSASVFGLLNYCKTSGGSRLLSRWLKQPLVDLDEINKRHLIVKLLLQDGTLKNNLQSQFLNEVPDITKLLKKLSAKRGNMGKLDDVIRLYQLCLKLPDALTYLNDAIEELNNYEEDEDTPLIKELLNTQWIEPISEYTNDLLNFNSMIEQTIDLRSLEEATSASYSNSMIAINPEYDEELMNISQKLDAIKAQIKEIHSDVGDDLNMELDKKLKLEDHHVHGWCMRLTRNDSSRIRGNRAYRELSTVKAGVYFTTSELSQASTDIKKLTEQYERVQRDIVTQIIETAATYSPVFTKLSIVLSTIDVLVSLATASEIAPTQYIRPAKIHTLNDPERKLNLVEARHPCLEQQDSLTFIANDISMSKDSAEFLIITGPNMGGKSTYIRTVGVIALMNQIGCFIPAEEGSEICIFDSILARVGASDSQLKGVSTFMSEMLEMSSILKTATNNSLIIVDELGRGTSTYDGFGLAWSISEFIAEKVRAFTLFATHFHELTTLADRIPSVKNLHVVAHVDQLDDAMDGNKKGSNENITLLYKVEPGISDQSFGIHVAELVKFPKKIIEMSKRKAMELDDSKSSEDERAKRAKFSNDEVLQSKTLLTTILKKWKDNVNEKGGLEKLDSDEVVQEMKNLVDGEFKDQFEADKVLQEMLQL